MDYLQLKEHWNAVKRKITSFYPELDDEKLEFCEGKEDELLTVLEEKTGQPREQLIEQLNRFAHSSL